jgi:enhancer of mRNA-decapping protein 3
LNLFKNAGGRKVGLGDLQRTIAALPSPPEIILDGLFGYLHSLDDIWDDDEKVTCVELVKWANTLRGRRISIDKPALAKTTAEEVNISLAAEWVIEIGALKEDVTFDKSVRVFVVDLGLGKGVWKEVNIAGTGKKKKGDLGIAWDGKWAVEVQIID